MGNTRSHELSNRYLDRGALAELIRQKAPRDYEVPGIAGAATPKEP